jgi:hypothetical protein
MKAGQKVRVFPHGHREQATIGTVAMISGNQRSIAVGFEHLPPFAFEQVPVVGVHPEFGFMMLAFRFETGPWIELAGQAHYKIEEAHEQDHPG